MSSIIIPRKNRIENAFCPYILRVTLGSVKGDGDGYAVPDEWLSILDEDSGKFFENVAPYQISMDAAEIERLYNDIMKEVVAVDNFRELSLAVAILIQKLTVENRIDDVMNQGVLTSNVILVEQAESGDWGDIKKARSCADKLYDALLDEGYFHCKSVTIH